MASATMRENSISRKTTEPHTANPRTPLTPLRHYVANRYPDQYKHSCDYVVRDRVIFRAKRFLGQIVDERPIGMLPDNFDVVRVFTDDFDGLVIGEREAIERMRALEAEYWSVCNQINVLFTVPAAPSFPTSRMQRGLV